MRGQPAGLNCPGCGEPPALTVGGNQAFCGNDDCRILLWDPALSVTENMAGAHEVDLRPGSGA
jgi:hypothetical protein